MPTAAAGVDDMMTETERAQLVGVDMNKMMAKATLAAHMTKSAASIEPEPLAPVKAAVIPASTVQAAP